MLGGEGTKSLDDAVVGPISLSADGDDDDSLALAASLLLARLLCCDAGDSLEEVAVTTRVFPAKMAKRAALESASWSACKGMSGEGSLCRSRYCR